MTLHRERKISPKFSVTSSEGPLPATIGSLSVLQVLNINENKLSGCIPESIGYVRRLRALWLEENRMKESIPEALGLYGLRRVYLSSNKFLGVMPREVWI